MQQKAAGSLVCVFPLSEVSTVALIQQTKLGLKEGKKTVLKCLLGTHEAKINLHVGRKILPKHSSFAD